MSYSGYIAKLQDLRPHPNADRLQLGTVFGNQVIVSLEYKEGDVGLYLPTDGKLGVEYAEKNNLVRKKDAEGNEIGGYLEPDKRHIRSIKLRGEFSDGLFMPLESLSTFTDISKLQVGDIIKELNGVLICEKYVPFRKPQGENQQVPYKKKRSEFVQFLEHENTKQLAYNLKEFQKGDLCYITNKMHGTSGRTTYTLQEIEVPLKWYEKLLRREPKIKHEYATATGTRRVVLTLDDTIDKGYYKDNAFREKYHDLLAPKLHKGETIYYEIVGFVAPGSPIMPTCDNKKVNDKEFLRRFGNKTTFTYGCQDGENDIYAYRMTMTNVDGVVVEYPHELVKIRCEQMGVKVVPQIYKFIYSTQQDLMEKVAKCEYAPDIVDPTHVNEGIVVRIERGGSFKAYKSKNIYFKILEGIIKEDALQPDMEEEEI